MRVIAGTKRSFPLKTLPGTVTRPTSDRIKETLFNIIGALLPGSYFLDLFAGSGQIGIEALSRGAERAVFVESSRDAVSVIKENLKKTDFLDSSEIVSKSVSSYINTFSGNRAFDIIFMDMPYDKHEENSVISDIGKNGLLSPDGLIVAECADDNEFFNKLPEGFLLKRVKDYGKSRNLHVFIEREL